MSFRTQPADDEAARLLAAQLDDLVRYRQIIEAQRAVLRMEDAGMLDAFSREADGLVADISAREVLLMAVRAAAVPEGGRERPHHRALRERVERERQEAGAAAEHLARQMEREAGSVAQAIAEVSRELEGVLSGYARRGDTSASPPLFERKG